MYLFISYTLSISALEPSIFHVGYEMRRDWKFEGNAGTFVVSIFDVLLLMQHKNVNVSLYFDVLLNVNMRYCILI